MCSKWGFPVIEPEDCPLIGGGDCAHSCAYWERIHDGEEVNEDDR